jgi:adenylate cyclase
MSSNVPGVEVHAEVLEQVIAGTMLTRPDWASGAERATAWAVGLLIAGVIFVFAYGWAAIVAVAVLATIPAFSFFAFDRYGLILGPTIPVLAALGAWISAAMVDYLGARRERREIRRQFEHFVAPDVIEEIASDPNRHMSPGGEERDLSILFCDVRQFSEISATLEPGELIEWLNGYLTPMAEAIIEERGTIDKFIGDAIMAFWNAPRRDENHARGALRGALRLVRAAEDMSVGYTARGFPPARIGVGINTGPCSVGRIGAKTRLDYTCVGDAVNIASRLEGLTKVYGLDICIGEGTAQQVPDFALIEIDSVEVLGRSGKSLALFAVAGDEATAQTPAFRNAHDAWAEALAAYRVQAFSAARAAFAEIAASDSGAIDLRTAASTMIARIDDFRLQPLPDDWDAVYRATRK